MIFILGGALAGKSEFAIEMARVVSEQGRKDPHSKGRVAYFVPVHMSEYAPEIAKRAAKLAAKRPAHWVTYEPPPFQSEKKSEKGFEKESEKLFENRFEKRFENLAEFCATERFDALVFDGLSLWIARELTEKSKTYEPGALEIHCRKEADFVAETLAKLPIPTIVTSNEVGLGVSPTHESGKLFRDLVSAVNCKLAADAKLVCTMQAGLATALKYPLHWFVSAQGQFGIPVARPLLCVEPLHAHFVWAQDLKKE